ncbi:MAG: AAA family ATPase [Caldilineaceae bacterium]
MTHYQFHLLGAPEIYGARQLLKFPTRKTQALLIYLAVEGGWQTREQILAHFWPESEAKLARAALRNTLTRLRTTLRLAGSPPSPLVVDGDRLHFDATTSLFDTQTLTQAVQSVLAHIETVDMLTQAVTSYRDDFLSGFTLADAPDFDDWASRQREHWHQQLEPVLARLTALHSERHELPQAIATARRWVAHSSLNEDAHQTLIRQLLAAGDRAGAQRAYEHCCTTLATALGALPSPETAALVTHNVLPLPMPAPMPPTATLAPQLPELPLVGRAAQFSTLVNLYRRTQQGTAITCIIEGEAGMGKSRLVQEFARWVHAEGGDIIHGRAFETGGRVPYQPVAEALQARLEAENAPEDLLSDLWLTELSRLLPDLRDRYPDLPLPVQWGAGEMATHLFEAVGRLGQALAARKPVLFMLDDLQWADRATLDLLHAVGRRWAQGNTPILLLFTLRSEAQAADPLLSTWLASYTRELAVHTIPLAPLPPAATAEVAAALVAATEPVIANVGRWLQQESGGQPFLLAETLKALVEGGQLLAVAAHTAAGQPGWHLRGGLETLHDFLPDRVRDVIRNRLARLSPAALALLTAAAVVGRRLTYELLCHVADVGEAEGLTPLDELLAGRLLVETDAHSQAEPHYLFGHDKTRVVVYALAGGARRRVFHRRVFSYLHTASRQQSATVQSNGAEIALHAFAAGSQAWGAFYSIQAGDAALHLYALHDAILHYQRATTIVATSDRGGVTASEAPLLDPAHLYRQLGRAHELLHQTGAAQEIYRTWLGYAERSEQPEQQAQALNRLATVTAWQAFDLDGAKALLSQAHQIATLHDDRVGLAESLWNLAQIGAYIYDPAAITDGMAALAHARHIGDPALIARCLNVLAHAYVDQGQWAAILPVATEACEQYRALGDRAMEADSLCTRSLGWNNLGDLQSARTDARRAHQIVVEIENPWGIANSAFVLALVLTDLGEISTALATARMGITAGEPLAFPALMIVNQMALGYARLAATDWQAANEPLLAAFMLNQQHHNVPALTDLLASLLCLYYGRRGDWMRAASYARQAQAAREQARPLSAGLPRWAEVEALLQVGEYTPAQEIVDTLAAMRQESPRLAVTCDHAAAVLATWNNDRAQARALLQRALTNAEAMGLGNDCCAIQARLRRYFFE